MYGSETSPTIVNAWRMPRRRIGPSQRAVRSTFRSSASGSSSSRLSAELAMERGWSSIVGSRNGLMDAGEGQADRQPEAVARPAMLPATTIAPPTKRRVRPASLVIAPQQRCRSERDECCRVMDPRHWQQHERGGGGDGSGSPTGSRRVRPPTQSRRSRRAATTSWITRATSLSRPSNRVTRAASPTLSGSRSLARLAAPTTVA